MSSGKGKELVFLGSYPGSATTAANLAASIILYGHGKITGFYAISDGETSVRVLFMPDTYGDSPTYTVDGVVHYCVANMPGGVARTSTYALNNVTLPHALAIAAA